ncbi:MAG: hypothetical protein ABI847_03265 [Anaerolineales bacterium]
MSPRCGSTGSQGTIVQGWDGAAIGETELKYGEIQYRPICVRGVVL